LPVRLEVESAFVYFDALPELVDLAQTCYKTGMAALEKLGLWKGRKLHARGRT